MINIDPDFAVQYAAENLTKINHDLEPMLNKLHNIITPDFTVEELMALRYNLLQMHAQVRLLEMAAADITAEKSKRRSIKTLFIKK